MPGFMDTLDTLASERATIRDLFATEGSGAADSRRATALSRRLPGYDRRVATAAGFIADVIEGRRPSHHFTEAMTTDDFPILFGDILDRQVLASYREAPRIWPMIAKKRTVRDFKGAKLFPPVTGADGRLDEVGQLDEYPAESLDEQAAITLAISKFGRRVAFSWEAGLNDDLDQLKDIPQRLGKAARRTENYAASELYVGTAGPHATLYSGSNIINIANGAAADNPPLSIAALTDAFTVWGNITDEVSEPIVHELATLVVPPALEVTANNIINATAVELTTLGGTRDDNAGGARLLAANWMARRLRVEVDPLIPIIADTNGTTSWFLFGDPQADREALAMVFLRGFEDPSMWIKTPNARRVGGGDVDPMDGDFDTDGIQYRVRHVTGSARIDSRATVASNGSGA